MEDYQKEGLADYKIWLAEEFWKKALVEDEFKCAMVQELLDNWGVDDLEDWLDVLPRQEQEAS